MSPMARKPSASERLAEMMDYRRVELQLEWGDVAKRGGISTESIRQARNGKNLRPLTQGAIERALAWQQGSMQAILDGGQPTPLPNAPEPAPHDGRRSTAAAAVVTVVEAIENDPHLLPEAKEHLLKQYGLLLRIDANRAAAAAVDVYDVELERRIAAKSVAIRGQRSMTSAQQERVIDIMEAEERARVPAFDGRRNPHLDVRFEESPDDDLTEAEAAAALADEESQSRQRQVNGC